MKIVFMGTPEFALATLKKIHSSSHSILSVVTQPDRPKGRGQKQVASPIKIFAVEKNIPVLQPETVNTEEFIDCLLKSRPDFIIVVAFGQILGEAFLKIPKQFCINLHSSLLPKYRGAAPINRAILNGDTVSGVTTMIMDKGMDTGDILLTKEIPVELNDDAKSLHDKLAEQGAELVLETLSRLEKNDLLPVPQNSDLASYAPKLKKEESLVDWERDAKSIFNKIRGLTPWPGTHTLYNGKRLGILKGEVLSGDPADRPGYVERITDSGIEVGTGEKRLKITELKPEGKKSMSVKSFLSGYKINRGDKLG
ncbi:MAG: methionyl-tRNA formyltransferase [Nitrospinae bacterium]|nr:methionyl-tRNA formyltransferase [Nitrospinota bacterium]MZH03959.1 methionyl-tRNA formyltransferase [Nitrospinota bacterium]MZH13853.1 methionyl-tRNA formyltransferase [Nitrospinota bacterium]